MRLLRLILTGLLPTLAILTPKSSASPNTKPLSTSLQKICNSHSITTQRIPMASFMTFFDILDLDPTAYPFYPPSDCPTRQTPTSMDAEVFIADALRNIVQADGLDPCESRDWSDVATLPDSTAVGVLAALALLDPETRNIYLLEFMPYLDGAWRWASGLERCLRVDVA